MQHRADPRRRRLRALSTASLLAGGAVLAVAAPAAAGVSGPCDGKVTIDGITYTPANDTPGNPIVVPVDAETAAWEGTTGAVPITDHTGAVGVVVGPTSVPIASWGGENADLETEAAGVYGIADARAQLPVELVGLYELTGTHTGDAGSCTGTAMVRIEGAPLTTPVGAGAVAATAVSLAGLALAGAGATAAGGGAGTSSTSRPEVP